MVLPPHRADIRRPDGLVIELQHSSISAEDIAAREAFYGNMWWVFHLERFGKNARFFLAADGRVRLRWLNGSRTLPRITKPMFCDLGGPVVEFTERVDRAGGWGRLLTRPQFLARAGLRSLSAQELASPSHHEVHWPPRPSDTVYGVLVSSGDNLSFWSNRSTMEPREVRAYRLDGSFEIVQR